MTRWRTTDGRGLVWTLAASLALAGGASAQQTPPAAPEQPEPALEEPPPRVDPIEQAIAAETPSGRTMESILADAIARRTTLRLRSVQSPTPDQYRLAATAFEAALRYAPDDVHMLRRLADAHRAAGDEAAELQTLRRVATLDPTDTVTQLRLLSSAIRSRQTVQDRLEAYDSLLGRAGERLDASLRSRLALDAALLARETGDERGFVTRLTLATQLDATNKAAAVLASRFALSRLDEPLARVEALANVVLADPVDRQAHTDLANELLAHGAYRGAARFFDRANDLLSRAGRATPAEMRTSRIVVDWATLGVDAMFAQFDEAVAYERYVTEQRQRAVEEGTLPAEEAPAPYVPRRWREEGRLAIALAVDNPEQTARALEALAEVDTALRQEIQNADLTPEEAERERAAVDASMLLRTLWADAAPEDAAARLVAIEPHIDPQTTAVIGAWVALREGRLDEAAAEFERLAEADARAAAGLALRYELEGRPVDASRRYALLVRDAPGTLLGMWARSRLERLIGSPLRETAVASELNAYAASLPSALDRMTSEPGSFIDLSVEHVDGRIGLFGRVMVRVRLRNSGSLPLAVGDEAPLNSRVLLSPELTLSGTKIIDGLTPEVVSLATRLRLGPGESLEVEYWAGHGATGQFLTNFPAARATLRWRALQGFGVRADGSFDAGVMSRTAMSDMLQRTAPPESLLDLQGLQALMSAGQAESRMRAISMGLWLLATGGNLREEEERFRLRSSIAQAIVGAWPSLSPAERAWTLFHTPDSLSVPEAAPIEEAAFAALSPETAIAMLMTRAGRFPDRVLPLGATSNDPLAARYAELISRIRADQSLEPLPIR